MIVVACYILISISYAVVPCAMYRYLRSMPRRHAEAVGTDDRFLEFSEDDAYRDVRRFVRFVLVASSIAILANGFVPIVNAFLLSNVPASWLSTAGAKFVMSAAIRVIWPLCVVYIVMQRTRHSTNIAKIVRCLLLIDFARLLVLMAIHTPSLFLGIWYPPPAGYDYSLHERLWAVCGASLTWMVLIILATLPYRWLNQSSPTCLDCGYLLKGLKSDRCPECGTAFVKNAADSAAS